MTRKFQWVITLGVLSGCLAVLMPSALAQYRVGDDGRALDANNQIGSGGYNTTSAPQPVSGNQIVTGDVTGGAAFRGNINYTDPRAFRGPTAGRELDRFIAGSSGVPQPGLPQIPLYQPQPFYGTSRAVPPPPGYQSIGSVGGYVPGPAPRRQVGDLRLGDIYGPEPIVPGPSQYVLPGPIDPSGRSTVVTASPLEGIRQWNTADERNQNFLFNYLNPRFQSADGRQRPDQASIDKLRQELDRTSDMLPSGQLKKPIESPVDPSLRAEAMSSPMGNPAITQDINTNQTLRQNLLAPPAQQSTQVAELQRRLEQITPKARTTDADANRKFQEKVRARQQAEKEKADAGLPTLPGATPGLPDLGVPDYSARSRQILSGKEVEKPEPFTGSPTTQFVEEPAPLIQKNAPLRIRSFAEGIKAQGLAALMTRAEESMRAGKFTSALDQYDLAEQVAPNNPMIWLGRATAELGATYYARAETRLRQAYQAAPELLLAQYDLNHLLGADRITTITRDLKEIATTNPKEPRPMLLLAFIAYNTGDEQRADTLLDMAEQRIGHPDPLYQLLRKHWTLPKEPAPNLNK